MQSDQGLFGLLFVGAILIGGVSWYFSWLQAKHRREEFAAAAAERGWTWTERDDSLGQRFTGDPFGRGSNRTSRNILSGVHDERRFVAFDYSYQVTTGTGKDRRTVTHRHSVISMDLGHDFPQLDVSPEGFFDRAIDAITGNDIDFESEDFNRTFRVLCENRKFASDVINPQMMTLLLAHPMIAWRFQQAAMVIVTDGQHSIAQVDQALEFADSVIDLVPEFVRDEYRGGPADPTETSG